MARSAKLTDLRRPIEVPVRLTDDTVTDLRGRYSLQVPKGWSYAHADKGVVLNQVDHLLGGVASPAVRVIAVNVPESLSAKTWGENAIQFSARQEGHLVKILSQGAARIAGADGYQFVLQKRLPLTPPGGSGQAADGAPAPSAAEPATYGQPFIEVARTVAAPPEGGRKRYHVVVVTCFDCTAQQAEKVMDVLAVGFRLLKP